MTVSTSNNEAFFLPTESLYYSLSILDKPSLQRIESKAKALADLVECLVLNDKVVYDKGNDIIDLRVQQFIRTYGLDSIWEADQVATGTEETFAPITFKFFSQIRNEIPNWRTDEDIAENNVRLLGEFQHTGDALILKDLKWAITDTKIINNIQSMIMSVMTEELLRMKEDIIDFIRTVFPIMTKEAPKDFWEMEFKNWDEAFDFFENISSADTLDQRNLFQLFFGSTFQGITESALNVALGKGFAFFPIHFQSRLITSQPVFAPSSRVFLDKVKDKHLAAMSSINDFIYNKYSRVVHVPILLNYIITKANKLEEIIDIALDLRETKEARIYRDWCSSLNHLLTQGEHIEAANMIEAAKDYIEGLSKRVGGGIKSQIQISFPPAVILDMPEMNTSRHNHLLFLKELYTNANHPITTSDKLHQLVTSSKRFFC